MDDCGVILVVDHDRRCLTRTALILRPLKHEVATAADAESALETLSGGCPLLAIVDVELPGLNGLGLLTRIVERFDGRVPVILTSAVRTAPVDRAAGLMVGADDYLVKPLDAAELVARVERTLRRVAPSRQVANDTRALSPREQEILGFLAEGKTQRQIADELVLSPKTVGTHIQHVISKLGVHSRAQAVAEAYRSRLVSPEFEGHLLATSTSSEEDQGAESLPPPALVR
ncbi:MAG TPA: response regulator transcription factor [Gaiella sp.]|jgi:DNA-binding NarL/FixJ family response regulator|nr:response regulator transcription factor [Gaiella sp.]